MNRTLKDWLIILLSLADDVAITLVILLIMWLFGIPITWSVIIFLIVFFVVLTLILHRLVIPAYHRRKIDGAEGMIGMEGEVTKPLQLTGQVKIKSEYWKAVSVSGNIPEGDKIEVVGIEGLKLKVKSKTVNG